MIRIRKALVSDSGKLVSLAKEIKGLETSPTNFGFYSVEELENVLSQKYSASFVVVKDDSIVGFIITGYLDESYSSFDPAICIEYLAVSPQHRRLGLSKQLMSACCEQLSQNGIKYVYSYARMNSYAINSFLKEKFESGYTYQYFEKSLM